VTQYGVRIPGARSDSEPSFRRGMELPGSSQLASPSLDLRRPDNDDTEIGDSFANVLPMALGANFLFRRDADIWNSRKSKDATYVENPASVRVSGKFQSRLIRSGTYRSGVHFNTTLSCEIYKTRYVVE
jgi:hypothetical protein